MVNVVFFSLIAIPIVLEWFELSIRIQLVMFKILLFGSFYASVSVHTTLRLVLTIDFRNVDYAQLDFCPLKSLCNKTSLESRWYLISKEFSPLFDKEKRLIRQPFDLFCIYVR